MQSTKHVSRQRVATVSFGLGYLSVAYCIAVTAAKLAQTLQSIGKSICLL